MSLFSVIAGMLKPAPPPDADTRQALARIIELVDPFLASASDFEHRLAAPIHHALGYCEGLVDALPGPVDITRQAFGQDPLVHALFATADDIGRMLGNSQAVRDFLADSGSYESSHFHALLAARRHQKRQFGLAMEGEVIHTDVPQTVVYFGDHTLVEAHCDLDATRSRLRAAAFDSLLKSFHAHIEALRQEKGSLAADASAERAHITILRGHSEDTEVAVSTRRLKHLDAHLREVADSLMPDPLEEALAAFLLKPEMSLHLCPVTLNIDRLGVVAEPDSPDATPISFPELCGRDRRRHLVMLARIDREEARQAVESTLDRQRRFMII